MTGTDTATTEAAASVGATTPAEETNEQAFADAFQEFAAEDDTKTAAPQPGPEKDDEPKAGAAAPAATDDQEASTAAAPDGAAEPEDIWADATPEQRAALEAAQLKLTAVEHENQSHRNRATAQNRKITELMSAPKPAAEPAAGETETPETDEAWEQFATDYPEIAGPTADRMGKQDKQIADLLSQNADLRSQVTGITDGQIQDAIDSEEALLVQRHPDWEQLTTTEDFATWLQGQPRYVQEGFVRNGTAIIDGQEAASLIDLFKGNAPATDPDPGVKPGSTDTATNGKATRRQRRLESAVMTESGQAGPGAGPPEGDFDAAFDHFAAQP